MSEVNSQAQSKTTTIAPYTYWAPQVLFHGHEVHVFKLVGDKLIDLPPSSEDRDLWVDLEPGEYVLVDIEKPSRKGEPYTIEVGELYVSANPQAVNRAVYRPLSLTEVMDLDKERGKIIQLLKEAKKAIKRS